MVCGLAALLVGCAAGHPSFVPDPVEIYEVEADAWRGIAERSVIALVEYPRFTEVADWRGRGELTGPPYADNSGTCEDEPFAEQPSVARCSGVLIDDRFVLTAAHCLDGPQGCHLFSYVGGYHYIAEGKLRGVSFAEDIRRCRHVWGYLYDSTRDYAIVELTERFGAAYQAAPLGVPVETGQPIATIGFGGGVPMKLSQGTVAMLGERSWWGTANIVGGNSGGGAFSESRSQFPEAHARLRFDGAGAAIDLACREGMQSWRLCGTGDPVCHACVEAADCPAGEDCRRGFCARPGCPERPCRSDHECDEGFCVPMRRRECIDGDPHWRDSCGDAAQLAARCRHLACRGSTCHVPLPGDLCSVATPLEVGTELEFTIQPGSHFGTSRDFHTDATAGSCGGEHGPERVFEFSVTRRGRFRAEAEGRDPILYLRTECDEPVSEVACNDDADPSTRSARLDMTLEAGTYFLYVDSFWTSDGDVRLTTSFE